MLRWPEACANCGSQVSPTAKFCSECGHPLKPVADDPRFASPKSYTPQHLAEKILTPQGRPRGRAQAGHRAVRRHQGLDGAACRPRSRGRRRSSLDPVLERMMEAVHRYEGTVNQVMGDGIMALFGAPLAHEDHAVRACYAALRMQETVTRYADEVRRSHGVPVAIRVGLNSGEVVVRAIGNDLHMDYTVVGQTAHLALAWSRWRSPVPCLRRPTPSDWRKATSR